MEQISGLSLSRFSYSNLKKEADLIYFDGPILSYFKNKAGERFFCCWCDADDKINRWAFFGVSSKQVKNYLNKSTTLYEIMMHPEGGTIIILDTDDTNDYKKILVVTPSSLPDLYIPDIDSYYEFEPFIANNATFSIGLDGQWKLSEFEKVTSGFSRSFGLITALTLSSTLGFSAKAKKMFQEKSLFGGGSHAKLYSDLAVVIDEFKLLHLESVQYASPGQIDLAIDPTIQPVILKVLSEATKNRTRLKAIMKETNSLIRLINKRKPKDSHIVHTDDTWHNNFKSLIFYYLPSDLSQEMTSLTNQLASSLGLSNCNDIFNYSQSRYVEMQAFRAIFRHLSPIIEYRDRGLISGFGNIIS